MEYLKPYKNYIASLNIVWHLFCIFLSAGVGYGASYLFDIPASILAGSIFLVVSITFSDIFLAKSALATTEFLSNVILYVSSEISGTAAPSAAGLKPRKEFMERLANYVYDMSSKNVMAMYPVMQAHVNFVLHAAGWLEGGLSAGYEKFVMDCELLGMYHTFAQGIDLSDEALAMESIALVEPGGHHLGTPHTMRHFRSAFYRAELFDYNSAEQWQIEGSLTAMQRANAKYKQLLKAYERPALDPGIEEALRDYMARRKLALRG